MINEEDVLAALDKPRAVYSLQMLLDPSSKSTDALQELLQFLYAECCTRNKALKPEAIVRICK